MLRKSPLRAKSKSKSKALERFHDFVAQQGCLVCGGAATVHHVTGYADRPGRFSRDEWLVVPLCPMHHQKVHDPKENDPQSVEGLSHQGFYIKHGIDLLAEAMRFADMRKAA